MKFWTLIALLWVVNAGLAAYSENYLAAYNAGVCVFFSLVIALHKYETKRLSKY